MCFAWGGDAYYQFRKGRMLERVRGVCEGDRGGISGIPAFKALLGKETCLVSR